MASAQLQLEVAIDEIVLLQPPEALPDLAGPDGPHALHGLEIALGGADDRVEGLEVGHDPADHRFGDAGDVREDAISTRLDRRVDRARAPWVAEQLRQAVEAKLQLRGRSFSPAASHCCR